MKNFIKISIAAIIAFVNLNSGIAQYADTTYAVPTYSMKVTNVTKSVDGTTLEWDVYLLHTNPTVTPFFYAAAQYFFNFNTNIALPGDSLRYNIVSSELPAPYRPVNASISGNILRLASNLPGTQEDSVVISSTLPGTRVLKLRLKNWTRPFQPDSFGLQWRSILPNPFTKMSAFTELNNTVIVDISTPATHTVDPISGINEGGNTITSVLPTEFTLAQNYPNPFNPTTKIDYSIPIEGKVSILIYDIAGREVMKLVNAVQPAGFYSVNFNGANLASGMYFYRINVDGEQAKNFKATKRMVLIK